MSVGDCYFSDNKLRIFTNREAAW